jgi:hypothetical protein
VYLSPLKGNLALLTVNNYVDQVSVGDQVSGRDSFFSSLLRVFLRMSYSSSPHGSPGGSTLASERRPILSNLFIVSLDEEHQATQRGLVFIAANLCIRAARRQLSTRRRRSDRTS